MRGQSSNESLTLNQKYNKCECEKPISKQLLTIKLYLTFDSSPHLIPISIQF